MQLHYHLLYSVKFSNGIIYSGYFIDNTLSKEEIFSDKAGTCVLKTGVDKKYNKIQ